MVGSNKGSLTVGWGSKAMKTSRVGGTSPEVGCSMVSGSMRLVTSPVDPSWCVEVRSSELVDGCGADTEVSVDESHEGRNVSALLSLSDSSIAFLKSWAYRFSFFFRLSGLVEDNVEAEVEDEETEDEACNADDADIEISDDEPPAECNEDSGGYDVSYSSSSS